jgi:hypothetical protein
MGLLPNHIHVIAVPETMDGLNLAVGKHTGDIRE